MKYFLIIFCLSPILLFSQKRDTIIFQNGSNSQMIITETYFSDKSKLTPIDHFMRRNGVEGDSIIYYFENEKIQRIHSNGFYHYQYDDDWELICIEKNKGNTTSYLYWKNQKLELFQQSIFLVEKFGKNIRSNFLLKNNSKDLMKINVSGSENIYFTTRNIEILPFEEFELNFKIAVLEESETVFQLINDENERINIPIKVTGYDLDDDNFFNKYFYKNQIPIDIGMRENIVIKLKNGERLLKIYHKGDLIRNYPLSQIVNKIDLAYFDEGEYLLEIIDLKNNAKKYCRIKKKGSF